MYIRLSQLSLPRTLKGRVFDSSLRAAEVQAQCIADCKWQEVAILRQAAANFRQRRLWVLKMSILPLTSSKMGNFQPQILFLEKIPTR